MKKIIAITLAFVMALAFCGCDAENATGSAIDKENTKIAANTIQGNQPTPTDLNYSLERYNLIRRAYWVNGQQEKANMLVCEVEKPLGYIALYAGSSFAGSYIVDGKVSSLNSYLTPDSEYFEIVNGEHGSTHYNVWLADVDGSYGQNDSGIFFFTPDGQYHEWTGDYHYSSVPIIVDSPTASYEVTTK